MSTLYIRLPSKAAADSAPHWIALACPFALASNNGAIEREGVEPLSHLSELVAKANRLVLLVAASDVTLVRMQVPPLSPAKLKAALPNLVEDQLITDPDECVVVAGESTGQMRTVAVMQLGWLEILVNSFVAFGAHQISALPAQLCLPHQIDAVAAAITEQGVDIDLAIRLSEHEGIGLPIMPDSDQSAEHEVVQALAAVVPGAPVTLYVPRENVNGYQTVISEDAQWNERFTVHADNWPQWIKGAAAASPDLMTGLGTVGPQTDWRPWRWPLVLACLVLIINVLHFNIDWWQLKREAVALKKSTTQSYQRAFPNEPISDVIAQTKQKLAAAKAAAGQASVDDFIVLAANFGEVWAGVSQTLGEGKTAAGLAGLDYREGSLFVRLKPEGDVPTDQMKAALAARKLTLTLAPPQAGSPGVIWQIRSAQ